MVRRSVIQADPQVVVSQRLIEAIETMTDVLGLIHEQARLLPTEAAQPTK
jgi:hypothetical protein